jgi:hypothetical protein
MKTTTTVLTACSLLGFAAFSGCDKKPQANSAGTTAPAFVPPSIPEPHLVSAQGTYFLLKKVTTETDSGVINFQPGTKLVRVNDRFITADGKRLTLRADQVTNNLHAAYLAAGRDVKLLTVIESATHSARAIQGTTPPAAPTTAATTMKSSGPVEQATYARPADGPAESRKSDQSRKNRN